MLDSLSVSKTAEEERREEFLGIIEEGMKNVALMRPGYPREEGIAYFDLNGTAPFKKLVFRFAKDSIKVMARLTSESLGSIMDVETVLKNPNEDSVRKAIYLLSNYKELNDKMWNHLFIPRMGKLIWRRQEDDDWESNVELFVDGDSFKLSRISFFEDKEIAYCSVVLKSFGERDVGQALDLLAMQSTVSDIFVGELDFVRSTENSLAFYGRGDNSGFCASFFVQRNVLYLELQDGFQARSEHSSVSLNKMDLPALKRTIAVLVNKLCIVKAMDERGFEREGKNWSFYRIEEDQVFLIGFSSIREATAILLSWTNDYPPPGEVEFRLELPGVTGENIDKAMSISEAYGRICSAIESVSLPDLTRRGKNGSKTELIMFRQRRSKGYVRPSRRKDARKLEFRIGNDEEFVVVKVFMGDKDTPDPGISGVYISGKEKFNASLLLKDLSRGAIREAVRDLAREMHNAEKHASELHMLSQLGSIRP